MSNDPLQLRPVSIIDKERGCQPGPDDILSEGEPGYAELKKALEWPVELIDLTEGFSPLERRIADQLIRFEEARSKRLEYVKQTLHFPYPDPESSAAASYKDIIRQFYINRWMVYPFTEDYINGIITTIEVGKDIVLNFRNPDRIIVEPLPDFFIGYILNNLSMQLLESATPPKIESRYAPHDLASVKDIITDHLYGPIGYYELGLDMAERNESYQSPVNLLSPAYGRLMASYILQFYKELKRTGLIQKGEEFKVYEHRGGDGRLAEDTLTYVREKALDPDWADFAMALKYVGVEIATAGAEKQKELKQKFTNFDVIQADAISWHPPEKSKGVVISVLLIDSFPPHLIVKNGSRIFVVHTIPTLTFNTKDERDKFLSRHLGWLDRYLFKKSSEHIKKDYLGIRHDFYKHLFLSRQSFGLLQSRLAEMREKDPKTYKDEVTKFLGRMIFVNVLLDAGHVPEVEAFLKSHTWLVERMSEDKMYINTDLDKYVKNIAQNYFLIGALMTVDVGSPLSDGLGCWGCGSLVAMSRPTLTWQRGAIHLALGGSPPSELFGRELIYLRPWHQLTMDTLDKASMNQAKIQPHSVLLEKYGGDIKKEFPKLEKLLEGIMEGAGPMMSTHQLYDAPMGEKKYLKKLVWGRKYNQLTDKAETSCAALLQPPFNWEEKKYYARSCANSIINTTIHVFKRFFYASSI